MICGNRVRSSIFLLTSTPPASSSTLSLHDALPISLARHLPPLVEAVVRPGDLHVRDHRGGQPPQRVRSEEHTSELQSLTNLVCRLLLEKNKTHGSQAHSCADDTTRIARSASLTYMT